MISCLAKMILIFVLFFFAFSPSFALLPSSLESSQGSHPNICATLTCTPWGLITACHLLTEINFSFRCLSFTFRFAKRKPQDVVVLPPLKMIQHRDLLSLASPLLFTLVVPGDGFLSAYGPCRHLTFPSRNSGNDTRIGATEASVLVAGNPHSPLS